MADAVIRMPDVEGRLDLARHHVGGARMYVERSDRGHHARRGARGPFDQRGPSGGRGQRIAPQVHGSGAGVVGFAPERHLAAALSHDGGHHAQRKIQRVQHRTLLDVKLQIAQQAPPDRRGRQPCRVEPEIAHRLRHGDAASIPAHQQIVIQAANQRHGCR